MYYSKIGKTVEFAIKVYLTITGSTAVNTTLTVNPGTLLLPDPILTSFLVGTTSFLDSANTILGYTYLDPVIGFTIGYTCAAATAGRTVSCTVFGSYLSQN